MNRPCWKQFIPDGAEDLLHAWFLTPETQSKTFHPRQSPWFIAPVVTNRTLLKTSDLFAPPEVQLKRVNPRQSQRSVSCLVYSGKYSDEMDPAENRRSVCSSWYSVQSSLSKAEPKVCLQLLIFSWKQLIQGRAKGLFAAPEIQLKTAYPRQSQRFVCNTWDPVGNSLSKTEPKVCFLTGL